MPKVLTIGETMAVMVPSETVPISISITSVFALPAPKAIQPSVLASLGIRQNGLAVWVMMNLDDFFYHEYVQKVCLFLMSGWMPMPQPV